MKSGSYRIGFIGLGRVADVHYAALEANAARAELAAVCDTRAEAVGERSKAWKVPGFTDIHRMLNEVPLDAVVVMLPHHVHLPVMRSLLEHRIPTLLEKPISTDRQEAREICDLAQRSGVPVLVGHNGLFHPAYDRVLEIVRKGWIGTPLSGSARSLQWLNFKPWDFRLHKSMAGGGAWIDCAGHLIYRLDGVFGKVQSVSGIVSHRARHEMEGEDTAMGTLVYQSGGVAQVMVSYGCKLPGYESDWPHGCEQSVVIYGSSGALEYSICPVSRIRLYSEIPGVMPDIGGGWLEIPIPESFEVSFHQQMKHFIDCLDGHVAPRVTPEHAFALLDTLLLLYEK